MSPPCVSDVSIPSILTEVEVSGVRTKTFGFDLRDTEYMYKSITTHMYVAVTARPLSTHLYHTTISAAAYSVYEIIFSIRSSYPFIRF